jgi:hypothetical protein
MHWRDVIPRQEVRVPLYDYRCPANDRTIEVSHSMGVSISCWGELCELAAIDPGETPADSPINKLISVPAVFPKQGPQFGGACCGVEGCGPNH